MSEQELQNSQISIQQEHLNDADIAAEQQSQTESMRRKELFKAYINSDDYRASLIKRVKLANACNNDATNKLKLWNACYSEKDTAAGCITFIETFGFTFDPRPQANPNNLPFVLYPYQKEAIRWLIDHIENGKDGLVEKSRDMGISWTMFVWVPIYLWLFRSGTNILLGSYKEALVDNRSKDSLFGMIDYAIDSLPIWMMPNGFKKDKHRTQMKLYNPANDNLISGDTMNPDFGRGTRKTAILFDELGSWDYAKDAWESAGDSTSCRIANSTPKGYNFYAMLRNSGIDVLTLHWSKHPLKDQKWYEFEKSRRTEEEVAQELDISYNKSQEGRVYPEWNDVKVLTGHYPYDPNLPLYVGWDYGVSDDTAIIWAQVDPYNNLRIVDTYRNAGKIIDFYVPFVTGIAPSETYKYTPADLAMIAEHGKWKRGTHFGDPAGRFTNQVTNTTIFQELRNAGIIINFKDEWKEFQKRKTAVKMILKNDIFLNNNPRTQYFNLCISNAAYPSVKNQGVAEIRSMKPKHDYTSHYRSALEYLALGLQEFRGVRREPFDKFKKKPKTDDFFTRRRKNRITGY